MTGTTGNALHNFGREINEKRGKVRSDEFEKRLPKKAERQNINEKGLARSEENQFVRTKRILPHVVAQDETNPPPSQKKPLHSFAVALI